MHSHICKTVLSLDSPLAQQGLCKHLSVVNMVRCLYQQEETSPATSFSDTCLGLNLISLERTEYFLPPQISLHRLVEVNRELSSRSVLGRSWVHGLQYCEPFS